MRLVLLFVTSFLLLTSCGQEDSQAQRTSSVEGKDVELSKSELEEHIEMQLTGGFAPVVIPCFNCEKVNYYPPHLSFFGRQGNGCSDDDDRDKCKAYVSCRAMCMNL